MEQEGIKKIRKMALIDAAYTAANGNRSKLARMIGVEEGDMHNWCNRGSKLFYWVAIKIHELSQVSLDRLAPRELDANDIYYDQNSHVKVFEQSIASIKNPSYFTVQATAQNLKRPILLGLKNMLIFGQETLNLAKEAGYQALRVIRLDT